jgi:hypothetical protein
MNHYEASSTLSSLDSDSKNYKSLYEEIAQNDSNIYLNSSASDDIIRYGDETDASCCCCKVHRRHNSFVAGGAVSKPFSIPTYNSIWIGEMRNATDYIEYLNKTRRNSFNSLNRDNRSSYYRLANPLNSLTNVRDANNNNHKNTPADSGNFLQVPKLSYEEQLRRTPELEDITKKIDQIHTLDSSVSSLIYKSIEVHADILVRNRWTLKSAKAGLCVSDVIRGALRLNKSCERLRIGRRILFGSFMGGEHPAVASLAFL